MKLLIKSESIIETPINLILLTQYLMKRGLKLKFAQMLHKSLKDDKDKAQIDELEEKDSNKCVENEIIRYLTTDSDLIRNTIEDTPDVILMRNKVFYELNLPAPIFTSISEKVSKKVRKYSRGKSGKYSHFWVYLPPHKRRSWVCKQVCSDIFFRTDKTFSERAESSFSELITQPENHFITLITLKTYNVIFKNYRQTLIKTYRRERY